MYGILPIYHLETEIFGKMSGQLKLWSINRNKHLSFKINLFISQGAALFSTSFES